MPERPRTGVRAVGGKESGEEEERPREESGRRLVRRWGKQVQWREYFAWEKMK